MTLRQIGAVVVCAFALTISAAEAKQRHKHARHDSAVASQCLMDNSGRHLCPGGGGSVQRGAVGRRVATKTDGNGNPVSRRGTIESRVERSGLVATINAKLRRWVRPTGKCGFGETEQLATYYSSGARTATGARFNPHGMTAAHRTLPFGTRLNITNPHNGRSVGVVINDRGPYTIAKIDLTEGAARAIGMRTSIYVCISGASFADALR